MSEKFISSKNYILKKLNEQPVSEYPFYHMYIENILPDELYKEIKEKNNFYNNKKFLQARHQDNKNFVNSKFSLPLSNDPLLKFVYDLFNDNDIKLAFLKKFFIEPEKFIKSVSVFKHECEFVYTPPNKAQDIHVDIPSKYVSLVFYLPDEDNLTEEEQYNNSTFLYDDNLNPVKNAKYKANSVCVFAPHFYSYHGFNTTVDRNALVMFYVNDAIINEDLRATENTEKERKRFKDNILNKMKQHPLIEYKEKDLNIIYNNCKINYNKGRVLKKI